MTSQKAADHLQDETGAAKTKGNGAPRDLAAGLTSNVREAAETVATHLPEAAATTRAAVDEAARRIEAGSDEMLTAGTTLSLGLAVGLLIGGAPRILVVLALIPAAAMGMTLLDRTNRTATTRASRGAAA
jgi:hypothetical protein